MSLFSTLSFEPTLKSNILMERQSNGFQLNSTELYLLCSRVSLNLYSSDRLVYTRISRNGLRFSGDSVANNFSGFSTRISYL